MDNSILDFIIVVLRIFTVLFLIFSIFVPFVLGIKKFIREKSLETDDLFYKIMFIFLFLTVLSYTLLIVLKNPTNILEGILSGFLLLIVLLFFIIVTLFQLRMFRGKGTIKRFFQPKKKQKKL
ncbi:MAG: hypothetical protein CVU39_26500 [Chloroflexi bacterium HGW-Chloroflexi-10]|nr:MAG: hypothetical protein CVU39_26500 [Chloroflexi bacterium HGW-Chloroflexi-10]